MSTAGLEILNLHAQGGMAEVYRARAVDEHNRIWYYAVKRMLPELLKEAEMMRMFIEEQRVAACLVHENIVRVYDVAQAETSDTFIVMEFLEGRDLSEVIDAAAEKKRTLPVWFCIQVAREILKALHYATTQAKDKSGRILGLIHRDISPHNIFVCRDGQVKLTDFGVAKVETAEVRTKAGIIKGKFGYMSPEQLSAQQLDPRSDLYNVGILLYESLTCKRLFYGETATQFIAAMMTNEIPPLDKRLLVPPELDALMRKSLAKKRDERPQTALQFEQQLTAIAERYQLVAQREHVAHEMLQLFPELLLNPPTDELQLPQPPATEPEQRPTSSSAASPRKSVVALKPQPQSREQHPAFEDPDTLPPERPQAKVAPPQKPPTKAKALTLMTASPAALISSSKEEAPVFTQTRQPLSELRADAARAPSASSSGGAGRAPRPVSTSGPVPKMPSSVRAQSSPSQAPPKASPPPQDDELVPTLMENRPSPEELGLEPAPIDLLAPDENAEGARTEPTRMPAFMADRPSTTAPGRDKARGPFSGAEIPDDFDIDDADAGEDEGYDPDAPTTEVQRPGASLFGRASVKVTQRDPPAQKPPTSSQQAPSSPPGPGGSSPGQTGPQPPSRHRVSTGSRRVISLTDEDEKKRR